MRRDKSDSEENVGYRLRIEWISLRSHSRSDLIYKIDGMNKATPLRNKLELSDVTLMLFGEEVLFQYSDLFINKIIFSKL